MDTMEARIEMLDISREATEIVDRLVSGGLPTREEKQKLRRFLVDARGLLPDAGYPAEASWRAIQRASIGVDTSLQHTDPAFWQDVRHELAAGAETLESLVSPHHGREADFHVVG